MIRESCRLSSEYRRNPRMSAAGSPRKSDLYSHSKKPYTSNSSTFSLSPLTTPRMAAFNAWQSPPLVNIPILFICFSSCFRLFVPSVHGLWVRIRTAVFLYRILPSSTPFCNCVSQHQRAAAPNSARKMPAPLRLIRVSAGSLCPDKYRNPP